MFDFKMNSFNFLVKLNSFFINFFWGKFNLNEYEMKVEFQENILIYLENRLYIFLNIKN